MTTPQDKNIFDEVIEIVSAAVEAVFLSTDTKPSEDTTDTSNKETSSTDSANSNDTFEEDGFKMRDYWREEDDNMFY